jgi:hypothetical protein
MEYEQEVSATNHEWPWLTTLQTAALPCRNVAAFSVDEKQVLRFASDLSILVGSHLTEHCLHQNLNSAQITNSGQVTGMIKSFLRIHCVW